MALSNAISKDCDEDEYRRQLVALQRIRTIAGGDDLDLPQIGVVGDQSAGKSALLAELTGINFPVNSGICTRAPIVVECKRDESLAEDVYDIEVEGSYSKRVSNTELAAKIKGLQNDALVEGGGGMKISTKEIRVRVSGPKQINIIVIDLPGIIHNGEGKQETHELIDKYIQKEQTLILLVSEAKQDDEGCAAIGMAQEWDEDAQRTLRVFTKCDTWDSDESRSRLIERMRGQGHNENSLSPHAVICRMHGHSEYDAGKERQAFEAMGLSKSRSGVPALKERLPPLFAELIRTNLPILEKSISSVLQKTKERLRAIGEEPRSGDVMLYQCHSILQGCEVSKLKEPISKHVRVFREQIHATKANVTKEWTDEHLNEHVFECPFFQGGPALQSCMRDVTSWWRPIMDKYVDSIGCVAHEHIKAALDLDCGVPKTLCSTIDREWDVECSKIMSDLKSVFDNRLNKEIPWGTMNHYLTSKFKGEEALPRELVDDFLRSLSGESMSQYESWEQKKQYILEVLTSAQKRWSEDFESKSLHEQQQQRLFHAVEAVWTVEKKTFVDYILKETTEHLIEARNRWLATTLLSHVDIKAAAVEDPNLQQKRQELKEKKHRMEDCMAELRGMQSHGAGRKRKADEIA